MIPVRFCLLYLCVSFLAAAQEQKDTDFVIAFGSCNKQDKENTFWEAIRKQNPDVWIWGGDNIYSDTEDMEKMSRDYKQQWQQKGYAAFADDVTIMGTWDDHDYGVNDGGTGFGKKKESQQLFLDFLGVDKADPRRKRKGVYHTQVFSKPGGRVKIIVLDTRYFRTDLNRDDTKKRYQPNNYGEGTLLGDTQWNWLENELKTSEADFNIIVSSIQVWSNVHGFETWGNFPHETDRLKNLIRSTQAKGIVFLSGDRHISEFSVSAVSGVLYPVVDFTSSGLTHAYSKFTSEPNPYRMGKVVAQRSYGLLSIKLGEKKVVMQMRGEGDTVLQEYIQIYP